MRIIRAITEPLWLHDICGLARKIELADRCNVTSISPRFTVPTQLQLLAYLADVDSRVIISHSNDRHLEGYLVVKRDSEKYGGCQGRWVGVDPTISVEEQPEIYRGMLEIAASEFGWVWGRIANVKLRKFLDATIPEGALMESDSEIITYKRP